MCGLVFFWCSLSRYVRQMLEVKLGQSGGFGRASPRCKLVGREIRKCRRRLGWVCIWSAFTPRIFLPSSCVIRFPETWLLLAKSKYARTGLWSWTRMCVKDTNLASFGSPCWRVKDPRTGTASAVCTDMSLRGLQSAVPPALCQATHRLCRPTVPNQASGLGRPQAPGGACGPSQHKRLTGQGLGSMVATSQRWYPRQNAIKHSNTQCRRRNTRSLWKSAIIQWDSNDALGFPLLIPCNPERMTNRCVHEVSTRCCLDPWFLWVLCTRQTHLLRKNIACCVPTFRTRLQLARTPNHYICFCSREAFAPSSNDVRLSVGFVHRTLVAFLWDEWKKATFVSKKLDELPMKNDSRITRCCCCC